MIVISAYRVTTETNGFALGEWHANNLREAKALARKLSLSLQNDTRYPNAFWVLDYRDEPVCKFWRGEQYTASDSI